MAATTDPGERARVGLCAQCLHAHVIENRRASRFYRCRRADHDPRFLRYPPLPVVACIGHERGEPARSAASPRLL